MPLSGCLPSSGVGTEQALHRDVPHEGQGDAGCRRGQGAGAERRGVLCASSCVIGPAEAAAAAAVPVTATAAPASSQPPVKNNGTPQPKDTVNTSAPGGNSSKP